MIITNEYKVAKSAEDVDWESVYKTIQTEAINFQNDTAIPSCTQHMKPYRYENDMLSTAFLNDAVSFTFPRRRVNGRRIRIVKGCGYERDRIGRSLTSTFGFLRLLIRQCLTGNDADRTKL